MRNALYRIVLGHRLAVALALVLVTAFFAVFAARVQFDNTIESYFLPSDLKDYNRFLDEFGSDEIVVVAFEAPDVFTPESLAVVDRLSTGLEKLAHVRRVLSLTTAKVIYGDAEAVHFDRLVQSMPPAPDALATLRRRALADPIVNGTLVSPDGRRTAVVAEIDHLIGQFDYKVALLAQVRELLRTDPLLKGHTFHLGGTSVLDDALFHHTQSDQTRFFPLMILMVVAVTGFLFRRVLLTLLPVGVVALTAVWTYGLLALLGYKINVITTILGPLLIAVGIADSIHLVTDFAQEAGVDGRSPAEALERAFTGLLVPCFLTTLTTALGLLSLLSADLVPIRQFGLVAAVGVCFALVITFTLVPLALSVAGSRAKGRAARSDAGGSPWLAGLAAWRRRKAVAVLVVSAVLVVPAAAVLPRLQVGTNSLDYFRSDDPVRTDTEWIDTGIGGTTSLEFFIDTGETDALKDPALLGRMDALQTYLEGIDGVTGVYSLVSLVKSLNQAFHEGDPRAYRLPGSAVAVGQQLLIVEGSKDLASFVSSDYSYGRVTARVELGKSQALAHELPAVLARVHEIFRGGPPVTPTGLVYLINRMEHYLLSSQMKSFALAFAVITLCMMALLRSVRLGLLAMIPNVLPIVLTLALMVPLGINLDVGTVMIAGVALGLVVDDSIHFLSRLRLELAQGGDVPRAIFDTMSAVGRPIVYTSAILALGFLVLLLASFNPVIHFGLLSAVVIVLALVCDLVVLPAIAGFALRPGRG